MSYFFTGQKVVCIREDWIIRSDDGIAYDTNTADAPKKDQIYTIDGIKSIDGSLLLKEIKKDGFLKTADGRLLQCTRPDFDGWSWTATAFRPLCTKTTETGMAILRGILASSPEFAA